MTGLSMAQNGESGITVHNQVDAAEAAKNDEEVLLGTLGEIRTNILLHLLYADRDRKEPHIHTRYGAFQACELAMEDLAVERGMWPEKYPISYSFTEKRTESGPESQKEIYAHAVKIETYFDDLKDTILELKDSPDTPPAPAAAAEVISSMESWTREQEAFYASIVKELEGYDAPKKYVEELKKNTDHIVEWHLKQQLLGLAPLMRKVIDEYRALYDKRPGSQIVHELVPKEGGKEGSDPGNMFA